MRVHRVTAYSKTANLNRKVLDSVEAGLGRAPRDVTVNVKGVGRDDAALELVLRSGVIAVV